MRLSPKIENTYQDEIKSEDTYKKFKEYVY